MANQTSLGRLFAANGVSNWDDLFPQGICEACALQPQCAAHQRSCAAIAVIVAMGASAAYSRRAARDFAERLREAVNEVRRGYGGGKQ